MSLSVIVIGIVAGLIGALVMNRGLRAIGQAYGKNVDMVREMGSFFTGSTENAARTGTIIHLTAGVVFGVLYLLAWSAMDLLTFPATLLLGLGFGFLHGMIMSYVLMILVYVKHPLEEYRKASFATAVIHLAGHILFGLVVGLISGLSQLF